MELFCPLRTTRRVLREEIPRNPNNSFWTKLFGTRWLDIGLVLFCEFMDLDSFSVHKHAIKGLGQYSDVLTSRMVNNLLVFVITVCLLNLRCVVK